MRTILVFMAVGAVLGCKKEAPPVERAGGDATRDARGDVREGGRITVTPPRTLDVAEFTTPTGFRCAKTIDPATIPATPARGHLNGEAFAPAGAGFWVKGTFDGSTLMFRAPAGKEGGCDRFFAERKVEVTVNAVTQADLGKPLSAGKNANFMFKRDDGTPSTNNLELGYVLVIDSMEAKRGGKVKGKVAVCFKDEKKSYIAGTFEADWCE